MSNFLLSTKSKAKRWTRKKCVQCVNLFISPKNPSICKLHEYSYLDATLGLTYHTKDREIARNCKRKNETQVQVLCIGILPDQTGMTGDDILQAKVYMKCFTTLLAPSK
jgi:hypothetical protein